MLDAEELQEERMVSVGTITSVYTDDNNTWLFTGHADGRPGVSRARNERFRWVRLWDLAKIGVEKLDRKLPKLKERAS